MRSQGIFLGLCAARALRLVVGAGLLLPMTLAGCGQKAPGGGGGAPRGLVEQAFFDAASATGIPARYLMATGYLESRLSPAMASANYVSLTDATKSVARGTLLTETAFGQTQKTLGLDPTKDQSAVLETQVAAYAQYVAAQLKANNVTLAANPQTPDDQFHWIENIAMIQREGLSQRKNVQVLFARELIQVLNAGFVWTDARNGQTLTMAPEPQAIDPAKFPANGQAWFQLDQRDAQLLDGVPYLPLVTVPNGEFVNHPKHVLVIHCPLTLSGCLELQTRNQESDIHLAAHYIIPPIVPSGDGVDPNLNKPMQVADLSQAVILTDDTGDNVPIEDSVVIMLAGDSGRIVDGARQPAVPIWFNDFQLRAMGGLINDVCTYLAQSDKTVDRNTCLSTTSDAGVVFRYQGKSEEDRWGDIADFDPTIFDAYVASPSGLGMAVAFDFGKGQHQYKAGDNIPLKALFDSQAATLELERLSRCSDNSVVWVPLRSDEVRGQTSMELDEVLHDSGPNRDGEQFFRLRVYGQDGTLAGWTIDHAYLSGFETTATFASDEYCGPKVGTH